MIESLRDPFEQPIPLQGLFQEIEAPGTDGLDGAGNVAEPGEKDNRNADAVLQKPLLELQPAQPTHPHFENQAFRCVVNKGLTEKLLRAAECVNSHSRRL